MAEGLAAIILAAGKGTRMRSEQHKVLHSIAGRPMIAHLLDSLAALQPQRSILVVGALKQQVAAAFPDLELAEQEPQLGTGHAVMAGRERLGQFDGDVMVLYGDTPLIPSKILGKLLAVRRDHDHALAVLGFTPENPSRYGRLIRASDTLLDRIVEYKDATAEERAVRLCNSGVMVFDGARLAELLAGLSNDNAAGEYYLTDCVALARAQGWTVGVCEGAENDVLGVNSRADLAAAEAAFQARARARAMADGVTLIDPSSVHFSYDTVIGPDTVVEPQVWFGPGVQIAAGARIHAFSHLEGVQIGAGAQIGPFARLRPGSQIGADAKVGNFDEVKKARLGPAAKASHLSYLGDAEIGADANIGAGTITCNYDGFLKYQTVIGPGAFIGSNTALVAPVRVGQGAIIGAGSTISRDVEDEALALPRAPQSNKAGWAMRFRDRMAARKKAAKG